jgi:glycosyltransferase involved in cell wall biosynthesis
MDNARPRAILAKVAAVVGRRPLGLMQPVRGVCFVAPEIDRVGGYELATLALSRSLRGRGIPVLIVTTTTQANEVPQDGDLIRIAVRGRHTLLSILPRLFSVLARERSRYSIIHCPTFSHLSGLAVLAGRLLRRPTLLRVATENDVREFAEGRHWKYRIFFWLLRGATMVIAPSAAIKGELLRAGFPRERIFCFANAVDVNRFRPATLAEKAEAKSVIGISNDTAVIGTVARLVQRKGIDVLLRALARVLRTCPVHLLVIGDGPLAEELRALARDLRIANFVSWLGFQRDPATWLRAMDVFALPSRLEGSPNAVLEGMAAGLPIVATNIGGVIDLLEEGRNGLLVPPDDPDALAAALGRLLRNAPLRAELGYRARNQAVEVFSLSGNLSRLMDLYLALQNT